MKTTISMLAVSATLMLSACQKEEMAAPAMKSGEMSATGGITDVTWVLQRMPGVDDFVPSDRPAPWFLLSNGRNEVTGFTGCNDLMGQYQLSADQLSFEGLLHTQRECPDAVALEEHYLQALIATDAFQLERGELVLLQDREEVARFVAK